MQPGPKQKYDPRKAAAQGTKKYSHYDSGRVRQSVEKKQAMKATGDDFLLVPQAYAIMFDQGRVLRGGAGKVGTWGMGPCVGFALFTFDSSHGFVGHFDSDQLKPEHDVALCGLLDYFVTFYVGITDKQRYKSYVIAGSSGQLELVNALERIAKQFSARVSSARSASGDFVVTLPGLAYDNHFETTQTQEAAFAKCSQNSEIYRLRGQFERAQFYQAP